MLKKVVVVSIESGAVMDVEAPPSVDVIIRDYDVDGTEENLKVDKDGNSYAESIW